MEFKREDCTFTIPDRPTVKQQLMWYGAASGRSPENAIIRYWEGAKTIIQKWTCPALPDYKIDLESITDPTQTSIVIWAAMQVMLYMNNLEDLPKNS